MQEDPAVQKRRNIIATLATLVVLAALSFFAWRVLHFVNLINAGEFTIDDFAFVQDYTFDEEVMLLPMPQGEFDVVDANDPSLGSPGAKVTIVEFADFGCPYSRKSSFVLRALARKYGDQVNYIYRDFPIEEIHPGATLASEAGECAKNQNKFWEFHDKLYLNQSDISREALLDYAAQINLDVDAFEGCLSARVFEEEVAEDYQAGLDAGVRGTPTFFINGNRVPGSIPEDILDGIIQGIIEREL